MLYPGSALLYTRDSIPETAEITEERVLKRQEEDQQTADEPEVLPEREAAVLIEKQGFVKEAPHFRDQVQDTSRTNTFKYFPTTGKPYVEMTEHEGLVGLASFLVGYLEKTKNRAGTETSRGTAASMLETLTFIGAKEYAEAAKGLGDYWKAFLDEDPERQLCVVAGVSRFIGQRKSDRFLLESILSGFSDEELERYAGRIVDNLEELTTAAEKVKVVMLDDWVISGKQMAAAYEQLTLGMYARRVEVNVLTASLERIRGGLLSQYWAEDSPRIPVKAYYVSHDALTKTQYRQNAHISGTHSSVDYDFQNNIYHMLDIDKYSGRSKEPYPPLTHIQRPYYESKPDIEFVGRRIVRKRSGEHEQ